MPPQSSHPVTLLKKRDWSQYGRVQRTQIKLALVAENCHKVDEYFPILNKMEILIKENEKLKRELVLSLKRVPDDPFHGLGLSTVMILLLECAKNNAGKKKPGYRYGDTLKRLGTVLFILSGPFAYNIISSSMPFPSDSGCRKYLVAGDVIQEGEFRFVLLQKRLEEASTNKVWISEDATQVTGRIQYDRRTNQIVGFVPPLDKNGIPISDSFPALSGQKIASYFDKGVVSKSVYVIMARPLAPNSPPMCLALFGTDNKFNFDDVERRWKWMTETAKQYNIEIVGFGSDGDPKLLKAMNRRMFVTPSPRNWCWFNSSLNSSGICIQDPIHVLMKLRSKLVKESDIIPMGKSHIASRGHLIELINTVGKDQHELTLNTIDVKDKMNFRSAQKLCDTKVSVLLRQQIIDSEGTALYLDLMRETTNAFLDHSLAPLQRIDYLWKWLFFLRLWRKWINETRGYTLGHNFISSNSFNCLEVNAHGMIKLIQYFRDKEEPELFQPWHFTSQDCEEFFRGGRSMTTTYSTVTNFSVLEFEHRVRRIDFLAESTVKLKDFVNLPRLNKYYKICQDEPKVFILPEDYEIEETVKAAYQSALKICCKLGIASSSTQCPSSPLATFVPNEIPDISDYEEDNDIDSGLMEMEEEENSVAEVQEVEALRIEEDLDIEDDFLTISTGSLGLKTFTNVPLTPESPFVEVMDGKGNSRNIKKTTLVWLLSNGNTKQSSDRLVRVQTCDVNHNGALLSNPDQRSKRAHKEDDVYVGDWCAFVSEDGSIAIGRVMSFAYMSGPTWRSQGYSAISAPIRAPNTSTQRGLGVLCSWFKISKGNKLLRVDMDLQGYYPIEKYICTIPRPRAVKGERVLSCSLREIISFKS